MPRECSVCAHTARREIDAALIAGRSCRSIAAEHGLDHRAVDRHRTNHLPIAIRRAAREAVERENAVTSAAQTESGESAAPIATARPAPSVAVPEVSLTAPLAGRTRRRGMVLDPVAPADPVQQFHREPTATPVGAPPSAPTGTLDLHEAALGLQRRAMGILENAERDGDTKTALVAIREARGVLEHLSRLQERTGGAAQAVPLTQSPEWTRTRTAIVAALEPFPDARLAVAEALVATGAVS